MICKTLRIILIVLFYLSVAFNQNNNVFAQLLVGAEIGAHANWIRFDDKQDKEELKSRVLPGYTVGFTSMLQVEKRFFLQASLIYSRKGKMITSNLDPALKNKAVNHYIDLPIAYKIYFKRQGAGKEFKVHVGFGPNLSYWLKSKGTIHSSELLENDIDKLDYKVEFNYDSKLPDQNKMYVQDVNRLQLGLNITTGFLFEPQNGAIMLVDLRYEMGGSFMAKNNQGQVSGILDYYDPMRIRNNLLHLSFSYLIDTKISERKKGKSTNRGNR